MNMGFWDKLKANLAQRKADFDEDQRHRQEVEEVAQAQKRVERDRAYIAATRAQGAREGREAAKPKPLLGLQAPKGRAPRDPISPFLMGPMPKRRRGGDFGWAGI